MATPRRRSGDSSARALLVDTSSEQWQCSIIEPERELCFSTHLACALPPDGPAMPLAAAANPYSRTGRRPHAHALRKLEPIRDGRRGSAHFQLVRPINSNPPAQETLDR
jgi:hypothetical protein